jgi:sigma-B regulation protein RsbU (phosphoserine phosphatase)
MKRSPLRDLRDWLSIKGWYPGTLVGKYTVYIGLLDLALWLVHRGIKFVHPQSDFAGGWLFFLTLVLGFFALLWLLQWIRRTWMWRLRNRLLITYVFIGVFPVVLLFAMFVVAGGIFAGQFATYLATNELHMELHRLASANNTLMGEAKGLARSGKLDQSVGSLVDAEITDRQFPLRRVTLWYRGKGYLLQGKQGDSPLVVPEHAKDGFQAMVVGEGRVFLRVVSRQQVGKDELILVSSVPVQKELLAQMAEQLGAVSIYPPDTPRAENETKKQGQTKVRIQDGREQQSYVSLDEADKGGGAVSAGSVPPAVNFFDWLPPFPTVPSFLHWENGQSERGLLLVQTRPSRLYSRLFEAMGKNASLAVVVLEVIAALLFIIELIALFIGLRLTRTITRSVAELYGATQYINKGEFHHRIEIRAKDQLAALEGSFNSMTASIEGLIAEQKEKQKMESELLIAQEVQALLFPREISQSESLEMHGVCRPARTVSGDYYDFLQLGENQIGLAVGDISGKGISAALLMATVHAFVRAYTIEEVFTEAKVGAAVGRSSLMLSHPGQHLPPATLLALLNEQLYRSTPASKYATMFLGFYDGLRRRLTYSNAGHLPPFVISSDGSSRKLGDGGMVVGLFGGVNYENDFVDMNSGDIIVAYSDGVTEPENEFGEFGEDRLAQIVRENMSLPLPRIADAVITAVVDWIGGEEQPDDITVVLARVR